MIEIYHSYHTLFDPILIAAGAVIVHFIVGVISSFLKRRFAYTNSPWKQSFVVALKKPLYLLIWVTTLGLIVAQVFDNQNYPAFLTSSSLRHFGLLIGFSWFILRWKKSIQKYVSEKAALHEQTRLVAFGNLISFAILAVTLVISLQILGFDISALIAVGGVGGLALGIAAKDIVANFFSGFMIYITKPFTLGEWIRIPERDLEGIVKEIGWYYTIIQSFSKHPVYVPNSLFSTAVIANPARRTHWKIEEKISITHHSFNDLKDIISELQEMVDTHPDLDRRLDHFVYLDRLAESSLDITLAVYTSAEEKHLFPLIKQDLLLKAGQIITGRGAQFSVPSLKVEMAETLRP